jgi:hypothetical protein
VKVLAQALLAVLLVFAIVGVGLWLLYVRWW